MKKIILMSLVLFLTLFTVTGCGNKNNSEEENNKEEQTANTSQDIIRDQTVDELTLTNTSLVTVDGQTTLVTVVTNSTDEIKTVNTFNIELKDEEGKLLVTLIGYVGGEVPVGESRTITSTTDADLSTAVSVEYTINS